MSLSDLPNVGMHAVLQNSAPAEGVSSTAAPILPAVEPIPASEELEIETKQTTKDDSAHPAAAEKPPPDSQGDRAWERVGGLSSTDLEGLRYHDQKGQLAPFAEWLDIPAAILQGFCTALGGPHASPATLAIRTVAAVSMSSLDSVIDKSRRA